jgi:hypothetical protein
MYGSNKPGDVGFSLSGLILAQIFGIKQRQKKRFSIRSY